jgi:cell division protein YceG involved in septum cleavage
LVNIDLPFGKNAGMILTKQNEAVRIKMNQKEGYRIMPKTITLRLSDEDFHLFQAYAKAENRTLANAIETLALKQIEGELFADEFEMEAILENKDLLERLKTGSEQAKRMKGRFVA